jgi:hypothetical protein
MSGQATISAKHHRQGTIGKAACMGRSGCFPKAAHMRAVEVVDPKDRYANQEDHVAMTIWRNFGQTAHATMLSRGILALAIMGAGLVSLTVVSHVRRATAPIAQIRGSPSIMPTVPPSAEDPSVAVGVSGAQSSSPEFSDTRFRFGFLEFEDDADAPSK